MLIYLCADVEEIFRKLMDRYALSPLDLYLSHRDKEPNLHERLVDHLKLVVEYVNKLGDHITPIAKLIKLLEHEVSGRNIAVKDLHNVVKEILKFIALYHDVGKAEIHYQLYAHGLYDELPPPHNYSSIAFIIYNEDVYLNFVDSLVNKNLSPKSAETIYLASLIAMAMHHEYYDYRDLSFIDVLTPLTLSLAKDIKLDTLLCFHETVYDVINWIANFADVIRPSEKKCFTIPLGEAIEYIATLHYEFGALRISSSTSEGKLKEELRMDKRIGIALSLAEVLTWILAIMDNLAARHRGGGEEERSFFAEKIFKWYCCR